MKQGLKQLRPLRITFAIATTALLLGIVMGIYQSIITNHRVPGLMVTYGAGIKGLFDRGQINRGTSQLQLALNLDLQNTAMIHHQLASAFMEQGRAEEAIAH